MKEFFEIPLSYAVYYMNMAIVYIVFTVLIAYTYIQRQRLCSVHSVGRLRNGHS